MLLSLAAPPLAILVPNPLPANTPPPVADLKYPYNNLRKSLRLLIEDPDPLEELDHATKYYIKRAEAPQTRRASALIHRSFFRPLARVRYDLVGQDRALEQLFRVLSMPMTAPIVVLLCGESGVRRKADRWLMMRSMCRP